MKRAELEAYLEPFHLRRICEAGIESDEGDGVIEFFTQIEA
jgi:hypothetical protein